MFNDLIGCSLNAEVEKKTEMHQPYGPVVITYGSYPAHSPCSMQFFLCVRENLQRAQWIDYKNINRKRKVKVTRLRLFLSVLHYYLSLKHTTFK